MYPILGEFHLMGKHIVIHSYPFFTLFLSITIFTIVSALLFKRLNFSPGKRISFILLLILITIISARFSQYGINYGGHLQQNASPFSFKAGGFFMYGGFLGAVICIAIAASLVGHQALPILDLITPGMALVVAVSKIGCFLNGCCFGIPTDMPWGVVYPAGSIPYYYYQQVFIDQFGSSVIFTPVNLALAPVQLYEALIGFIGFLLAGSFIKKKYVPGAAFLSFAAVFSLARWILHYMRASSQPGSFYNYLPMLYGTCFIASCLALVIILAKDYSNKAMQIGYAKKSPKSKIVLSRQIKCNCR